MRSHAPLPRVPNLRRVPGAGALYRSAAPAPLDEHARAELAGLGLRTVIDLREEEEAAALPVQLPADCRGVAVPLYCGPVPLARPLPDVYRMLLEARSTRLVTALRAIAHALPEPVLLHCKAGKDRTGLVIALLLDACGIERERILADYQRSAAELGEAYREQITAYLGAELGERSPLLATALELHLDSPARALELTLQGLADEYGSVRDYLLSKGLAAHELNMLQAHVAPAGLRVDV